MALDVAIGERRSDMLMHFPINRLLKEYRGKQYSQFINCLSPNGGGVLFGPGFVAPLARMTIRAARRFCPDPKIPPVAADEPSSTAC